MSLKRGLGTPDAAETASKIACIKQTGRIGQILKHDPQDPSLSFKLAFQDGKVPKEDWFAANDVEVVPSLKEWATKVRDEVLQIGHPARVGSGEKARIGQVLEHDPSDKSLNYKVKFSDGMKPESDWLHKDKVEVQPALTELRRRAQKMRSDAQARLAQLQGQIVQDFEEYISRLKVYAAGNASASAVKMLVGLVPLAHTAAEASTAASLIVDMKALLQECVLAGKSLSSLAALYTFNSTEVTSQEHLLLNVLTRQTRILGEKYIVGGPENEPGHRVLAALIEIKALFEQLRTLDELGFFGNTTIGAAKL